MFYCRIISCVKQDIKKHIVFLNTKMLCFTESQPLTWHRFEHHIFDNSSNNFRILTLVIYCNYLPHLRLKMFPTKTLAQVGHEGPRNRLYREHERANVGLYYARPSLTTHISNNSGQGNSIPRCNVSASESSISVGNRMVTPIPPTHPISHGGPFRTLVPDS